MNLKTLLFAIFFSGCSIQEKKATENSVNHFPLKADKVTALPSKEKFYLYILAGQSNMAGRGFVQPEDTVSSQHVLTLDKNNEWVYAKEPLHYYEPERTGLDCGLSFGKELTALYNNKITVGLIPCAVGGSSIEQWLGDSTYRDVTLYSNLLQKVKAAAPNGILKGILWHQGETNANEKNYKNYKQKLEQFFTRLRNDINEPELPVYAGQLASFLSRVSNPMADSVNKDLQELSSTLKRMYIINTTDLGCKPDSIHFDSPSQRAMGKRFAKMVFKTR